MHWRPVYTAVNTEMAAVRFAEFADKWGTRYPAIINLWRSAWEEFIPFLDYDVGIRKIICSTNAIESLNARYRRAVRARAPRGSRHRPAARPSIHTASRPVTSQRLPRRAGRSR